MMMPVMNGWDSRRLRIANPALVDIQSLTPSRSARVAEELNVQCFRKPVALDDVLNVVANACVPRP